MRSFRFPAAAVISLLFMSLAQAQTTHSPLEKDFVAGGTVKMDLESGQYVILACSDNRIHIRWNEADRGVRVKLDTNGTSADLRVENTPHDHFRATIEVPASTNLNIYFTAGDLRIDGIKGDKKVDMNAGDLNIAVGDSKDWASVDASVAAGDINASAFQVTKSGLLRSVHWHGPGKYKLDVSLKAGDINLKK